MQLIEEQKRQAQLREIELRKQEKKQDLLEKKRIKELIEADKRERRERVYNICFSFSLISLGRTCFSY